MTKHYFKKYEKLLLLEIKTSRKGGGEFIVNDKYKVVIKGVNDEDFDKAKESGVSDAQLYKQAGNAIVVDVLENIFEQLFQKM